jgi:hypothetical protein
VVLKYGRFGAVAMTAGLIMSMAGAGAALAGELPSDVVADGVVTVHWVDPDDGPMAGASIRISWYHDGDPIPGFMPAATTDAAGDAVITNVPRAAEGSTPVLLDIRGDLSTVRVDEAGCTVYEDWIAETKGETSAVVVEVALVSDTKSINLNCPEPTPTPVVEATPTPTPTEIIDPVATPTASPTGEALGAVGTPNLTPPPTDEVTAAAAPTHSPFVPILLALLALAMLLVPVTSRVLVHAQSRPRDQG